MSMNLYYALVSPDQTEAALVKSEDCFKVGDIVEHQDKSVGTAKILSFGTLMKTGELVAYTDKGYASLSVLRKVS